VGDLGEGSCTLPRFFVMSPDTLELELTDQPHLLQFRRGVHVTELLRRFGGTTMDWLTSSCTDGELAEDAEDANYELPWASECLGRILSSRYGWVDDAWSIEESGIVVAPAYFGRDRDEAHLCKATSRSIPADLSGYWRWVAELKALCHVLGCSRGILHVCHSPAPGEDIVLAYGFQFEPQDLDGLWGLLLDWRASMDKRKRRSGS